MLLRTASAGVVLRGAFHLLEPATALADSSPDVNTKAGDLLFAGGAYFTEAGAGKGGYRIADTAKAHFWTKFQKVGGVATSGYPNAEPCLIANTLCQPTQYFIFQKNPANSDPADIQLLNVFDILMQTPTNIPWLQSVGVAAPDDTDHDPTGATYAQAVARRDQALTNAAITQLYRKNPNPAAFATWDPESFYGLAKSKLTKMADGSVSQTFQRVGIKVNPDGEAVFIFGGDIAKRIGLIPGDAAKPQPYASLDTRPYTYPSGGISGAQGATSGEIVAGNGWTITNGGPPG
jgi:hypothetical protein